MTGPTRIPPAYSEATKKKITYLITAALTMYPFEHNFLHKNYVHLKTIILVILLSKFFATYTIDAKTYLLITIRACFMSGKCIADVRWVGTQNHDLKSKDHLY